MLINKPLGILVLFVFAAVSCKQGVALRHTDRGFDFQSQGRVLLTYQTAMQEVPEGVDSSYRKSGFIHPLYAPSGEVLTRIQPSDHLHHYGIWGPYTRTQVAGRSVDFWNLGEGQGTVLFDQVLASKTKKDYAELTVRQNHLDLKAPGAAQVAIAENLTIRVWELQGNRYQVDYTSVLTTPLDEAIILEAYRYGGGIGFRATARWGTDTSHILTSEGDDRKTADGSFARWVMVYGESDDVSGQSGVLFLSHPENRAHPEPMRVWPEDFYEGKENVFVEFCPIRHEPWELRPTGHNTLRYRLIVFDGDLSREEAEAYWKAYSTM